MLPLLDRLAAAEFRNGNWQEATEVRRRALRLALAYAPDQAATAMTALALLYIDQQQYLDAEPLLLAAYRVRGDRPRHPALPRILAALARVAAARGDVQHAVAWGEEAVALAPDNPQVLHAYGAALVAGLHFDKARQCLERALAVDREQQGPESIETARSLALLARLELRENRPQAALPLLQQTATIDQASLPPGHPFIGDDLHDLGLAYEALKRPREAIRFMEAALRSFEGGAARDTPRVAYVESDLSRLYRESGDPGAADTAFRDARRILNKAEAEERRRERQV